MASEMKQATRDSVTQESQSTSSASETLVLSAPSPGDDLGFQCAGICRASSDPSELTSSRSRAACCEGGEAAAAKEEGEEEVVENEEGNGDTGCPKNLPSSRTVFSPEPTLMRKGGRTAYSWGRSAGGQSRRPWHHQSTASTVRRRRRRWSDSVVLLFHRSRAIFSRIK